MHEDNIDEVGRTLGLPCVLKGCLDGAFSKGVMKAADESELRKAIEVMLGRIRPADRARVRAHGIRWRVGVLDRRALGYVCRYHGARTLADRQHGEGGTVRATDSIPVEEAPPEVVKAAIKAANLIGDGLAGVDLKLINDEPPIIEVNDNPNLEAGVEDAVLKEELGAASRCVLRRIEAGPHGTGGHDPAPV
ncbi:MAG: hypothetical protein IPP14_15540 [Planctomycetes bacterium]|nr:hypothetical protein [Planctomycetota bacterium]